MCDYVNRPAEIRKRYAVSISIDHLRTVPKSVVVIGPVVDRGDQGSAGVVVAIPAKFGGIIVVGTSGVGVRILRGGVAGAAGRVGFVAYQRAGQAATVRGVIRLPILCRIEGVESVNDRAIMRINKDCPVAQWGIGKDLNFPGQGGGAMSPVDEKPGLILIQRSAIIHEQVGAGQPDSLAEIYGRRRVRGCAGQVRAVDCANVSFGSKMHHHLRAPHRHAMHHLLQTHMSHAELVGLHCDFGEFGCGVVHQVQVTILLKEAQRACRSRLLRFGRHEGDCAAQESRHACSFIPVNGQRPCGQMLHLRENARRGGRVRGWGSHCRRYDGGEGKQQEQYNPESVAKGW